MSVEDENATAAATSETVATTNAAEVVKTEATAAPETQEGEAAVAATETAELDENGKPKTAGNRKPAAERIQELSRQKNDALRRAERAEARVKALEVAPPVRENFATDDDFTAAVAKTVVKDLRREEFADEAKDAHAEADAAVVENWQVQREEASARLPDFDEVINAVPADVFSAPVAQAILSSDMAADVAYVLAKDLPRARRFAASTPLEQGREIGRIEAELSGPKPRKISSAPPPVDTVGSKGPGSGFNPATASVEDMAKHLGLRK